MWEVHTFLIALIKKKKKKKVIKKFLMKILKNLFGFFTCLKDICQSYMWVVWNFLQTDLLKIFVHPNILHNNLLLEIKLACTTE
jgi:hypothetical protein